MLFGRTNSGHVKGNKKCYLAELILITLKGSKTQASIDKQGEHVDTNFKDEFTSYRVTSEKYAGKAMNPRT